MANDENVQALLEQIIKKDGNDTTNYDIHLNGENIVFADKNGNNDILVDGQAFYNYLKNYFSKKMFVVQSDDHPDGTNDNIIIWNDTGFDDRFRNYLENNYEWIVDEIYYGSRFIGEHLEEFENFDNQKISNTENNG